MTEAAAVYVKELSHGESSGHDWWHVKRVHDMALRIAEAEEQDHSVNRTLVELIAYLHDVFDEKLADTKPEDGLPVLIKKLGLHLSDEDQENLIHSVCNLSFSHSLDGEGISHRSAS